MSKKLKITLIGSRRGCKEDCKRTVDALGLGKMNSTKVHPDNPAIRGMIFRARHLLKVEEVNA